MRASNIILIHAWPIVQIGIRQVLQSLKIDLQEIFPTCPKIKSFKDWKGAVVLFDIQHEPYFRKHHPFLQKQDITLVGLNFMDTPLKDQTIFDELVLQTDNPTTLYQKLNQVCHPKSKQQPSNQLSIRENEVLKQVALGLSNKQISEMLFISKHTVITHRKHITSKLGIKSISGLTLYAILNNLVE